MVNHSHWRSWWGMQEAEQRIIRCQGDWSHSPCPLRASRTKPALWSATGCDIYSHFYRLWVSSHPNATCEFLGVISSWCAQILSPLSAYHRVVVLPRGARSIVITEKALSASYLVVRMMDGEYFINGKYLKINDNITSPLLMHMRFCSFT